MKKPIKKYRNNPAFSYSEIKEYIKSKYGKDLDNWTSKWTNPDKDVLYLNFWHIMCDIYEFNNGSYFYLSLNKKDYKDHIKKNPERKEFILEILKMLNEEFPEEDKELYMYVSW